ncbi:MAG TPA: hypothetical protein VGF69_00780 [Thermoanaerobaculia bacterium]|jgi:hypothetical protein
MIVRGGFVYAADGRGLVVYEPAQPRRVAVVASEVETRDLVPFGDDELVVATADGLHRYRFEGLTPVLYGTVAEAGGVTEVAATASRVAAASGNGISIWKTEANGLTLVRRILVPHTVHALAFVGDQLYAAIEGQGVRVFNSDSGGSIAGLAMNARDFALSGSRLFVAAAMNGVFVVDVSNPAAPRVAGSGAAGEVNMTKIAVSGTRLFALQEPNKVYVLELDGNTPHIVRTLDEPARAIAATDGRLLVSGMIVDALGLERGTGIPLRAYDAATLSVVGDVTDLAGPVSGAATDGTFAYVADAPYFRVLDVSTTSAPKEVARLEIANLQDRVRIKRGLAVLYGRADVNIVDISDPYNPRLLGTYRSSGRPPSNADIARDTIIEANDHSGLHVVDMSDPANPVQIAGRIWHYVELLANEDAIYAFHNGRLVVLDITDRRKVVDRGNMDLGIIQAALSLGAEGREDLLLVLAPYGVHVLSLADPYAPRETALVPLSGVEYLGADAHTAYLATGGVLSTMNLDNPASPGLVATDMRVTSPMQISAANGKIVVADRYSLRVYGPDSESPVPPAAPRRRAANHRR